MAPLSNKLPDAALPTDTQKTGSPQEDGVASDDRRVETQPSDKGLIGEAKSEIVGRTWPDILSKLATPIVVSLSGLMALFLLCALLSARLDLLAISYDGSWHWRLGVDEQEIERQKEEQSKQAYVAKVADWTASFRKYFAEFVLGVWTSGWEESIQGVAIDSTVLCNLRLRTEMSLQVLSYDPIANNGVGNATLAFDYSDFLTQNGGSNFPIA